MVKAIAIERRVVKTVQLELTEKEVNTLLGVLSKVGGYDGEGGHRENVNAIRNELLTLVGGPHREVHTDFICQSMLIRNN